MHRTISFEVSTSKKSQLGPRAGVARGSAFIGTCFGARSAIRRARAVSPIPLQEP
jgi:hypothetical protein